jgi:hypothetical protein
MTEQTQTYKNHARWYPLVHFVIFPLLLVNLGWQIYMLTQERTLDRAEMLLVGVILVLISFAARLQPLRVQDRIIRLEEKLRYHKLLPHDVAEKASHISMRKMIALRFAPDDELPELVGRILDGKLNSSKEIKTAIENWRGDHLRA